MVEIPKFPELTFDEATHLYRLNGAGAPQRHNRNETVEHRGLRRCR